MKHFNEVLYNHGSSALRSQVVGKVTMEKSIFQEDINYACVCSPVPWYIGQIIKCSGESFINCVWSQLDSEQYGKCSISQGGLLSACTDTSKYEDAGNIP